eukprot:GSMAST32.ASY1.ANO1.879.1 assembled CDS
MDPVLNKMLAEASFESSTVSPSRKLIYQLQKEGGVNTAKLLVQTAEALKKANLVGSSDFTRREAERLADLTRDSTFEAIGTMEMNDDAGIAVTMQHRCAWLGAYSFASIQWAESSFLASNGSIDGGRAALRAIDLALLRGGPHWNLMAKDIISKASKAVQLNNPHDTQNPNPTNETIDSCPEIHSSSCNVKRKVLKDKSKYVSPISRVPFRTNDGIQKMTISEFKENFMKSTTPVIITGSLSEWPALKTGSKHLWSDASYLKKVAGDRIVPVEVCNKADNTQTYLSNSWAQKVMTLSDFITNHVIPSESCGRFSKCSIDNTQCAYLAQHPLFDQIPFLKEDIIQPSLCSALLPTDTGSDATTVHVNACMFYFFSNSKFFFRTKFCT